MANSYNVLVTGATGFIGRALVDRLLARVDADVIALVRRQSSDLPEKVSQILISGRAGWGNVQIPSGLTTVVHLAGRAHVLKETSSSPIDLYREDNVDSTLALARQALAAGVKRFIFISSIGVNGSSTEGKSFDESSTPAPKADYAISKWEAEQGLRKLLRGTEMELVIIRPPLVYAGHAPGNFRRLMRLVGTGLPLPFASINNFRSMVSLENLVDFISVCLDHPAAANEVFLISDGVDFSTPQIVERLAEGMGRRAFLLPMPLRLMRWVARGVGKEAMYEQLCGSLIVNSSKAHSLLGWSAPLAAEDALMVAGRKFREMTSKKQ